MSAKQFFQELIKTGQTNLSETQLKAFFHLLDKDLALKTFLENREYLENFLYNIPPPYTPLFLDLLSQVNEPNTVKIIIIIIRLKFFS